MLKYISIIAVVLWGATAHAETWVCTYPGENNAPKIQKFIVTDDLLIQNEDLTHPYKIILNNEIGIAAASAFAAIDPNTSKRVLVIFTILIDKNRNTALEYGSNLYGGEPALNMSPTRSACIKN